VRPPPGHPQDGRGRKFALHDHSLLAYDAAVLRSRYALTRAAPIPCDAPVMTATFLSVLIVNLLYGLAYSNPTALTKIDTISVSRIGEVCTPPPCNDVLFIGFLPATGQTVAGSFEGCALSWPMSFVVTL
jgi:hypothetical protein